jgi:putative FmdB family regulatory protein
MPTYEFECQTCGHRHEIIMKMSEYDGYPKTCQQLEAEATQCGGELIQVYDDHRPPNHILLGHGWTPRFGPVNRG